MVVMISGIIRKEDDKRVCVLFSDDNRMAEGTVPACKIISNTGFSKEEVEGLDKYLRESEPDIWEEALKVNPLKGFLGM